jgi:sensor histidine kinase YesM
MLSAKSKLLSETDKREAIQRLQKRLQLLKMSSPFLVLDLSDDPPSAQKACRCVPFGGARKSGCRRPSSGQGEFSYLFRQFNDMVGEVKVLIHEVYEKNFRLRLSELKQLQSQINPHFLYNSFSSVYRMAKFRITIKSWNSPNIWGTFSGFLPAAIRMRSC